MKRYAMPMAWLYASYVLVNLILYPIRMQLPPGVLPRVGGLVYAAIALGISAGAAILLTRRREELT